MTQKTSTHFKLSALAVASSMLLACGSGDAPAPKEISGQAVKGLMANAKVELFGSVGGSETLLDSSVTDTKGDYQLDVPDNYTGPVKLVVTATPRTTMLCDAPAGCANVPFGEPMKVVAGTSMSAVMRNVLPNQPVNIYVTPITNMAAAKVETLGGLTAESVATVNEEVAAIFKLPGNFVSIKPTDVTDSEAVGAAASSAVNYGVLAGAFAGGSPGQVKVRLDQYANAYAAGALFEDSSSNNPTVATIKQIFENAEQLAAHIQSGDVAAQYDSLLAGLGVDQLATAPTSGSTNSELDVMVQAALDDVVRLSGTVNQQTVETYIQSQVDQLSWIITPELLKTLLSSVNVVKEVMFAALGHDYLVTIADSDGIVDRSALAGGTDNVEVLYNVNTNILSFKTLPGKTLADHEIDFEIEIHPVSNGVLMGELPYTLKQGGTISNVQFSTAFNKDSSIKFIFDQQDDFTGIQNLLSMLYALLSAAQCSDPVQQQAIQIQMMAALQALPAECTAQMQGGQSVNSMLGMIDCVVGDFVTGLDASGYLEFGMQVSKTSDLSQQYDIDFKGFADLNFTDPNAATVARLEIQNGHLFTPNGDRLFTVEGAKGLVLDLGNTNNTLFARFGVDSMLIPETYVTVRGAFHDLQHYLDLFNGTPMEFDFNELKLASVFAKPFQTGANFLVAFFEPDAIINSANYLFDNTTPRDYIKTLSLGLDVQADALWPVRRYDVEFIDNELHLTNQDGVSFIYTAEQGAIISTIRAFGNDLVVVRVTEEGVSITDIDDQITLDVNDLPIDEMMSLYARLGILIDLDDQAQDLLNEYAHYIPSIDLGAVLGN